jgi:hypothetical protein
VTTVVTLCKIGPGIPEKGHVGQSEPVIGPNNQAEAFSLISFSFFENKIKELCVTSVP